MEQGGMGMVLQQQRPPGMPLHHQNVMAMEQGARDNQGSILQNSISAETFSYKFYC
jgi:hypothetical protein